MCRRGPGQQNSSTLFCNLKLGTTAGRGKSFSASFLSALSQHDLSAVRVGVVVEEFFILKQKKVILAVPLTCVTRHLRKLDCVCRLPWYSRARLLEGVRQVDGLPHPRRLTLWCNSEGLAPGLYSWAIKRGKPWMEHGACHFSRVPPLPLQARESLFFEVEPGAGTRGGCCSQAVPVQSSALPPLAISLFSSASVATSCAARGTLSAPVILASCSPVYGRPAGCACHPEKG